MDHLGIRRTVAALTLIALGAVALVGCASLPTAPAATPDAASVEARLVRVPGGAEPGGLVGDLVGTTTSLLEKTVQTITGVDGGTVTAGRFSVEVPPGAITGTGEVSVTVPDTTVLRVDLHILNAPNEFNVPVTLEISYAGAEGGFDVDPTQFKIFWHDEERGVWRMLPTEVDLERQTVSTRLEHFSTYGVLEAKAGW